MGIPKRIFHILMAIVMIILALVLILLGEAGTEIIALIQGLAMLFSGLGSLIAYFTKFRYVIGGRNRLYIGILSLDFGLLLISSFAGSKYVILLYLLGIRLFTGGISLARALEARKNKSPWVIHLISAIVNLGTVILGLIYFSDPEVVVDIYCLGLLISAVEHFYNAFRRSTAVSIA